MKKFLFLFGFSLFFPAVSYAAFENCEAVPELPNLIPTQEDWEDLYHEDWNEAYLLRGDDGSMWQRAVLSNANGELVIRGGSSRITGLGTKNSPLQIFMFSTTPDDGGRVGMPAFGNCVTPGNTSGNGQFSFSISAAMLWGNLGSHMVFDVYTRLSDDWDGYNRSDTNQNFFFGTHKPMQLLEVTLPPVATNDPLTQCASLCPGSEEVVYESLSLNPIGLSERLRPNFFLQPVTMARNPNKIYFANWNNAAATSEVDFENMQKVVHTSLMAEWIKRMILPTNNGSSIGGNGIGDSLSSQKIRDIYTGTATIDPYFKDILDAAQKLLINTDRNAAASQLAEKLSVSNAYSWKKEDMIPLLLELFPGESTIETWAEDFDAIIDFWTGSNQENICLLSADVRILQNPPQPTTWDNSQAIRCNMNTVLIIP